MTTYFILDRHSNTWSDKHYPLSNILATPGITEGHILANARTQQTLTVAQARTLAQKSKPLSNMPGSNKGQNKPGAYMSLSAIPKKTNRRYKVISQNDNLFNGQFSAQKLNNILNTHAQQGWRVINCTTAPTYDAQGYERHELLVVLEKAAD